MWYMEWVKKIKVLDAIEIIIVIKQAIISIKFLYKPLDNY